MDDLFTRDVYNIVGLWQGRVDGGIPPGLAGQMQDGVGVCCGPGQHADRLSRGQDDEVDLAAPGLVPDLLQHRQRAVGAGADHQLAA